MMTMSWMQLRGSPKARHRAIHLATRFDYWHELVYNLYIMSNYIEAIVSILLIAIELKS